MKSHPPWLFKWDHLNEIFIKSSAFLWGCLLCCTNARWFCDQYCYYIIINFLTDESWDVATPQSASRSGDLNDNNNQRLKDKEDAEPKIKNSERRTKEQDQNLNDVYDFFDS